MRPENYQSINHPPSHQYELFFGPNHPGIEGNYALRVQLRGDEVIGARADGGYLHRGFEKLMEGRLWIQNIALVPRICVPDPVPMEVCYSLAVEEHHRPVMNLGNTERFLLAGGDCGGVDSAAVTLIEELHGANFLRFPRLA